MSIEHRKAFLESNPLIFSCILLSFFVEISCAFADALQMVRPLDPNKVPYFVTVPQPESGQLRLSDHGVLLQIMIEQGDCKSDLSKRCSAGPADLEDNTQSIAKTEVQTDADSHQPADDTSYDSEAPTSSYPTEY